jgi:hypothetical protein
VICPNINGRADALRQAREPGVGFSLKYAEVQLRLISERQVQSDALECTEFDSTRFLRGRDDSALELGQHSHWYVFEMRRLPSKLCHNYCTDFASARLSPREPYAGFSERGGRGADQHRVEGRTVRGILTLLPLNPVLLEDLRGRFLLVRSSSIWTAQWYSAGVFVQIGKLPLRP